MIRKRPLAASLFAALTLVLSPSCASRKTPTPVPPQTLLQPTPAPTPTPLPTLESPPPSGGASGAEASFPSVLSSIDIAVQTNASSYRLAAGEWLVRFRGFTGRLVAPLSVTPATAGRVMVTSREGSHEVSGVVEIASVCLNPIPIGDGTYRGTVIVRPTARGTLHVINHVSLEDYLKGVVPAEMGPRVYDEVEALKAQAVAARSYAVRHRGSSAAEGYDLCATPACQVYGGVGAEHPLSSRAVEATAGEVLIWNETIADTLFTSTCGGETEMASEVFPSYAPELYPYLASVRCSGETPIEIRTSFPAGRPAALLGIRGRALLASLERTGTGFADIVAARDELRSRMGLKVGGGPKTLQPAAVWADLKEAVHFGDASMLTTQEERDWAPAEWPEEAKAGYAMAVRFQLAGSIGPPTDRNFTQEEVAGLYAALLGRMGDFEEVEGRFVGSDGQNITVKNAKGKVSYPMAPGLLLASGSGDRFAPVGIVKPTPGDKARLFVRDGSAVGLALFQSPGTPLYERESSWIHWIRRFTGAELMEKLKERDASRRGTKVTKIEVLHRGASGRATKVAVTTDAGTVVLTGLQVRFNLALPEMLFTFAQGRDADGPVFTFFGRGWGHGVGLCQNGAYGLAIAGRNYKEILSHYYLGTTVEQASRFGRGIK